MGDVAREATAESPLARWFRIPGTRWRSVRVGDWSYVTTGFSALAIHDDVQHGEGETTQRNLDALVGFFAGETPLDIDLADLFDAMEAHHCADCWGTGRLPCHRCDGKGQHAHYCAACDGNRSHDCEACDGGGTESCVCGNENQPGDTVTVQGVPFSRARLLRCLPTGSGPARLGLVAHRDTKGEEVGHYLQLRGDGWQALLMQLSDEGYGRRFAFPREAEAA